jgi:uncharacterized protein (TIGR02145 family)
MFGVADNNGKTETHKFVYLPVTNPDTGKTWLNNNLGADYANIVSSRFNPAQQAKSSTDYKAYGSLFQWGRKADGHELIKWTNGTTGTGGEVTKTRATYPHRGFFIARFGDWRAEADLDYTLWANEKGENNVCPVKYRLPTENEWKEEFGLWNDKNSVGALKSTLKLSMAGDRSGAIKSMDDLPINGDRSNDVPDVKVREYSTGIYWSGSVDSTSTRAAG